jgi:hypothetical protein
MQFVLDLHHTEIIHSSAIDWIKLITLKKHNPQLFSATGSFMEKPTITKANLSDVRVIMAIMLVLVEELLCQAVMG